MHRCIVAVLTLLVSLLRAAPGWGLERVTIERQGSVFRVSGRVMVEAQDGGLLLLAPDGLLWTAQPDELTQRSRDDAPFQLLQREDLTARLLNDLPAGFRVHDTAHYLICYNTSDAYAQWCGALYERLYRGFRNYWSRRGLTLTQPVVPLVALVFADKSAYARYARPELGKAAQSIVGYYSLRTNRIMTYDLTGVEQLVPHRQRLGTMARINQILSQPNARPTVATIVHEATHQLAFNCGLHHRYADIPLWVSEGIAMFFETPDLRSSKGWRGIGINVNRLGQLRQYLRRRPADSLTTLLADDRRFRRSAPAVDAYAESWGLCHFLLQRYPKQFRRYLQELGKKEPLRYDKPEERLELFQSCFEHRPSQLDVEFVRYVSRLR